jgi:UDP-N-acetylmuramyl pentapeptide phosphotransferase/UDP-N-acetylglucosamine-1-phosphate transferase
VGLLIHSGYYFIITVVSNGANLTDGIDGLMAEPAISVLALRQGFLPWLRTSPVWRGSAKAILLWYGLARR